MYTWIMQVYMYLDICILKKKIAFREKKMYGVNFIIIIID